MPAEASEALLELATGGKPRPPQPVAATKNPFEHPDAQRRFRVIANQEELQRALDYPWERWTIFLHPDQRALVERDFKGPARVSGSAGTGKTIVALHRAAHLARTKPDARVLLTTFSDPLASALHTKLKRLLGNEPRLGERIDVHSLNAIGLRLYKAHVGAATTTSPEVMRGPDQRRRLLPSPGTSSVRGGPAYGMGTGGGRLATGELGSLSRRGAPRAQDQASRGPAEDPVGHLRKGSRRPCLSQADHVRPGVHIARHDDLQEQEPGLRLRGRGRESQGMSVSLISGFSPPWAEAVRTRCFSPETSGNASSSSLSLGKPLGVDIRGRSRTLRVNYRTSHQIRQQADRLLGPIVTDVDGNKEDRSDTVSVFNGPPPTIRVFKNEGLERKAVGNWVAERGKAGMLPHEVGVFVRSGAQLGRAQAAVKESGTPFKTLDEHIETVSGHVSIGTMPLAKGLEFRAVVVMACDNEVVPLQEQDAKRSGTRRTWRRSTTPSGNCSTWLARGPGTSFWSRASSPRRSFLTTWGGLDEHQRAEGQLASWRDNGGQARRGGRRRDGGGDIGTTHVSRPDLILREAPTVPRDVLRSPPMLSRSRDRDLGGGHRAA